MIEIIYEDENNSIRNELKDKIKDFIYAMISRIFLTDKMPFYVICKVANDGKETYFHLKNVVHPYGIFLVNKKYRVDDYAVEELKFCPVL